MYFKMDASKCDSMLYRPEQIESVNSARVNSQLQKTRMLWHVMFSGLCFLSVMVTKVQLFMFLLVLGGSHHQSRWYLRYFTSQ